MSGSATGFRSCPILGKAITRSNADFITTPGCSPQCVRRLPLFLLANPLHDVKDSSLTVQDASDPHRPTFRPRHETKPIERFYDLFFIANLTVFSIDHEINNGSSESAQKDFVQPFLLSSLLGLFMSNLLFMSTETLQVMPINTDNEQH